MTVLKWLPRFRRAYREMDLFASRETWTRQEIERFQLERLNKLWQTVIQTVPFYKELYERLHLPSRFASLGEFSESVPILEKHDVQNGRFQLLSRSPERGSWKLTGGSTGSPTYVYRSKEAHLEMLRSRYRFHAMWGVDILDRMVSLWGHCTSYAPGLVGWISKRRIPLEDYFRNRLRLSAYDITRDRLRQYLDRIAEFRPVALYGYAMAGHLLAAEAETVGFTCDSLRWINLTAEPVAPRTVELCQRVFRAPTVAEYGSVECGFLAGEWLDRTLRVREDLNFLETLPRPDGRYDIVVTVLGNPSFPLLRYRLGDITDRPLEVPSQGFSILHNVSGRNIDAIISRTGRCYHGTAIMDFMDDCKNVRRYQIHQAAGGAVTIRLEASHLTPREISWVTQQMEQMLEGFPVTVEVVDDVPQTLAGKHRFLTSELAQAKLWQLSPPQAAKVRQAELGTISSNTK